MVFVLRRCRELYNAALQERKEAWEKCGVSINVSIRAPNCRNQSSATRIPRHPLPGAARRIDPAGQRLSGLLPARQAG